jgi:hypothetical protein
VKRRTRGAREVDVFGPWRHIYAWTTRAGVTSRVKRRARVRERREAQTYVRDQLAYDVYHNDEDALDNG